MNFLNVKHAAAAALIGLGLSGVVSPALAEIARILFEHYDGMLSHYGLSHGTGIARKHLSWYLAPLPGGTAVYTALKTLQDPEAVKARLRQYFEEQGIAVGII